MVFGLSTFAWIHTIASLVALVAGFVVVAGLLGLRTRPAWTGLFLASAVATSATGFGFPFDQFLPSHWVGVFSLVVLAVAIPGLYAFHLAGAWRWVYAVGAVVTLYFLVFVAIAQAFMKVPALHAMAPTLSEPPFAYAQIGALIVFAGLAIAAALMFRPAAAEAPA